MNKPITIKQLVIDETKKLNGEFPSKDLLANLISKFFPDSKWKDTHYAWYKHQISSPTGKYYRFLSDPFQHDLSANKQ